MLAKFDTTPYFNLHFTNTWWDTFSLLKPQCNIFPIKKHWANFEPFSYKSFMHWFFLFKKLILIIPEKPWFQPLLGHFWPKNLKTRLFWKKTIRSVLSLHATVSSQKKSEKFCLSVFHKTWKTSFWGHYNTFWPKNIKTRFFP